MSNGSMNLSLPRSDKNVWEKPGFGASLAGYDQERWLAAGSGALMTLIGARRGGVAGGLMAAAGAALAIRAAIGRHDVHHARGWVSRTVSGRGFTGYRGGRREDVVDEAAEESFPASDSPSWTASRGARADG